MIKKIALITVLFSAASLMIVGCAGQVESKDDGTLSKGASAGASEPTASVDQQLTAELEGKFNSYAQALLDNDIALLDDLMSGEIKLRNSQKGYDMAAFASKLKRSMLSQFKDVSANSTMFGHFTVESIRQEGEAMRVEMALDGVILTKPFYFVNEGGDYKLNLLAPGFSNPLPEGAGAANSSYNVANINPVGIWEDQISCTGGTVTVPPGQTGSISCPNNCGYWTGSLFHLPFGSSGLLCDWNTWGTDVYLDGAQPLGFRCNDRC